MSLIKEEVLFHCLYWVSPVISMMAVMMEWLEATYHVKDPLMVFYRVVQKGIILETQIYNMWFERCCHTSRF